MGGGEGQGAQHEGHQIAPAARQPAIEEPAEDEFLDDRRQQAEDSQGLEDPRRTLDALRHLLHPLGLGPKLADGKGEHRGAQDREDDGPPAHGPQTQGRRRVPAERQDGDNKGQKAGPEEGAEHQQVASFGQKPENQQPDQRRHDHEGQHGPPRKARGIFVVQ